jgi:aspartate-semialdehyde dehydrogenase
MNERRAGNVARSKRMEKQTQKLLEKAGMDDIGVSVQVIKLPKGMKKSDVKAFMDSLAKGLDAEAVELKSSKQMPKQIVRDLKKRPLRKND